MQDIKEIITSIGWPHITLIFGITFLYMFRSQIGNTLQRLRSVGKDGVTIDSELNPQKTDESSTDILQHIEIEKTIMLSEVEASIFEDLKSRNLDYQSDTVKVLVRNLAITQLSLDHEQTYNTIFSSQIHLLKKLNEASGIGKPVEYIEGFYKTVVENNEEAFSAWSLDDYLQYLKATSLITYKDNNWQITNKGQDFLIWLVRNGKAELRSSY